MGLGHLTWMPPGQLPLELYQATSYWTETSPGQTLVERLYFTVGLGTSGTPGGSEFCDWR